MDVANPMAMPFSRKFWAVNLPERIREHEAPTTKQGMRYILSLLEM